MEWLIEIIKQILFYKMQGVMIADPVSIMAVATLGSGALNYFGNQSASNTQAGAASNAANMGLQGTREGIQAQKDIYNKDRQREYEAAQYLRGLLPNFDMTMTDPNQYFGTGNVNAFYDKSKLGLNQQYQMDLSDAQTGAGEQAASRGLLNPSLLSRSATNQVQQNYLPQFTGLEANRAGALLQNNKDLYQALLSNEQYQNMLRQLGYTNQFNLANNFGNPNIPPSPLGTGSDRGGRYDPGTRTPPSWWNDPRSPNYDPTKPQSPSDYGYGRTRGTGGR